MKKLRIIVLLSIILAAAALTGCSKKTGNTGFVIEDGVLTEYTGDEDEIVVPDGVTELSADLNLENIKKITIPGSVKKVGANAFISGKNIEIIVFSQGVEEIENYAFSGLCNLKHVYIPSSVTDIGSEYEITKDETFVPHAIVVHCAEDKEDFLTGELADNGFTIIPDYEEQKEKGFDGYTDDEEYIIINDVFYLYNGSGETIIIPDGVTAISQSYIELNAKKIIIPGTVKKLEPAALSGCSFEVVAFEEGVEELGDYLFGYTDNLKDLYIPSTVTKIGEGILVSDESNISPLTIHCDENMTEWLHEQFDCYDGYPVIPDYAEQASQDFAGYTDDEEYIIINDTLYQYNGSDEKVVIPDNVKKIEKFAVGYTTEEDLNPFSDGYHVKSLYIPDSAEIIAEGAFCYWPVKIKIESGRKDFNSDWFGSMPSSVYTCDIYIPESVTEFETDSLYGSENLVVHCKKGSAADGAFGDASYVYDYDIE